MWLGSISDNWWKRRVFSACFNSSTKANTWPCPASVYFCCSCWNSSGDGSRRGSCAGGLILSTMLETAPLTAAAMVVFREEGGREEE